MQQILVVDDSPANLQLIEIILVAAGYRVRTCATVKNAFQMLRSDTFDLVITDKAMPEMNGDQLAVAVKSRSLTSA